MKTIIINIISNVASFILGGLGFRYLVQKGVFRAPTPIKERVAEMAITGRGFIVEGGRDWRISYKVRNVSSFIANNLQIYSQEYSADRWSTSFYVGRDSLAPEAEVIQPLKTMSLREMILEWADDKEYIFALRVQWENPNGTIGCILRYARLVHMHGKVVEDATTYISGPEFIVLKEPPEEIPPATLPPCPD